MTTFTAHCLTLALEAVQGEEQACLRDCVLPKDFGALREEARLTVVANLPNWETLTSSRLLSEEAWRDTVTAATAL